MTDPFITNCAEFHYNLDAIDGVVLDLEGFKSHDSDSVVMQICNDCHLALKKCLPRLSLANHLYRGKLPNKFKDLTWVEEMVCVKY